MDLNTERYLEEKM